MKSAYVRSFSSCFTVLKKREAPPVSVLTRSGLKLSLPNGTLPTPCRRILPFGHAPAGRSPLCRSSAAAASSLRMTFAGHRPDACVAPSPLVRSSPPPKCPYVVRLLSPFRAPDGLPCCPGIRLASMFSAPVPCASTFAAMVPLSLLRARMIGSCAGFSAVPHPAHCAASGVAGAVCSV